MELHSVTTALLLAAGSALAMAGAVRAAGVLRRLEQEGEAIRLVRAIRWLVSGIALAVLGAGKLWNHSGLIGFGIVFLLEELYETTMVLGVLKWERRAPPGTTEA
jgi:hypothetical protein